MAAISTSEDTNVDITTYPIRLRNRGQITVPQSIRANLNVTEGDVLTMIQVGDLVLLTPKQPQVPQLADKIIALMEDEEVSLADLLLGLEEERTAIWQERRQDTRQQDA